MRLVDLMMMPPGSSHIYRMEKSVRTRFAQNAQATAFRKDASVITSNLNAFDSHSEPVYLVEVTVLKTARPRSARGRK